MGRFFVRDVIWGMWGPNSHVGGGRWLDERGLEEILLSRLSLSLTWPLSHSPRDAWAPPTSLLNKKKKRIIIIIFFSFSRNRTEDYICLSCAPPYAAHTPSTAIWAPPFVSQRRLMLRWSGVLVHASFICSTEQAHLSFSHCPITSRHVIRGPIDFFTPIFFFFFFLTPSSC